MTDEEFALVRDLAEHAAIEAREAIIRVADLAPKGACQTAITVLAASVLFDGISQIAKNAGVPMPTSEMVAVTFDPPIPTNGGRCG